MINPVGMNSNYVQYCKPVFTSQAQNNVAINPNVEIIGIYIGRHSPVRTRCRICGYEWSPYAAM